MQRVFKGSVLRRSLIVAVIVGTILNLINQGDGFISGRDINYLKLLLTYLVPFCVSSYGAYTALKSLED
ncbi:MAG: hypothetical protein CMF31_02805 [Kordiimonas sp.]|nr:hypothetical protein [Kordiimonas sp.]